MAKRYRDAGVDIEAGDSFADHIRSIESNAVRGNAKVVPGGFAGGFAVDTSTCKHPVVLTTTDGVGTKLLVARQLGIWNTVGIDLVAMCVNDLIVHGAQPVQFLDYIACERIDRSVLDPIIEGIVAGCEQAGCTLSGGETAELPGLYERGGIDLAGFAVGLAEQDTLLPRSSATFDRAALYGLPSSGIHSNGLSLARSIIGPDNDRWYRELLTPTRIYVKEVLDLVASGLVIATAHVTGGGIEGNLSRVIPEGSAINLSYDWDRPAVFDVIAEAGDVDEAEMRRVFNLGIGMVCVVEAEQEAAFTARASDQGTRVVRIGELADG